MGFVLSIFMAVEHNVANFPSSIYNYHCPRKWGKKLFRSTGNTQRINMVTHPIRIQPLIIDRKFIFNCLNLQF